MFYVNEFADRLKHYDPEIFEELSSQGLAPLISRFIEGLVWAPALAF